jgi:hypothetical protein
MGGDSRATTGTPAADRNKRRTTTRVTGAPPDSPHVSRGLAYTVMFLLFVIWSNSFHGR